MLHPHPQGASHALYDPRRRDDIEPRALPRPIARHRPKQFIQGEKSECSGTAKVTPTEITGDYACKGVTSHDPKSGMGKVDIKVRFTAKS